MHKQYFLTNAAEADLEQIIIYTLHQWGNDKFVFIKSN